jgi:hypothetical protein
MPPQKLLQKSITLKKNVTTRIEIWIAKNPNQNTTCDLLVSTQFLLHTHNSKIGQCGVKMQLLLECRTLSWKLEHPSKKPIPEGSCLCNSFVPFNYLFPNPSVGYGICEKGEGFGCFVCWMNYVKSWSNIW